MNWRAAAAVVVVIAVTSYVLKKNWYDLLDKEPPTVPAGSRAAPGGLEHAGG
jgi:hypothetical protein